MMPNDVDALPPPYRRIQKDGQRAWAEADHRLENITNTTELRAAQRDARLRFNQLFGPLPDPSAKVGCRVEAQFTYQHIIIERIALQSAYGYDISAWSLRRADLSGKVPGVAVAAGHGELGSLCKPYLKMALLLAMSGMHVVSFDPPGQGARREVFRPEDHPVFWDPCKQHMHLGMATTLAGLSLPHFFVADGMTVVSHLCAHPGVDAGRIGFTGQSGGGIQTFYMMGADPRIAAAVTSQATSSRRGAFQSICFRDMCQTSLNQWTHAIDQHEMVLLFAPRPVRILAEYGYEDQLDVYRKLQRVYEAVGHEEDIELVSGSVEHRLSRACRELTLSWFQRYLAADAPDVPGLPGIPGVVERIWPRFEALHRALCRSVEGTDARGRGIIAYCQSFVRAQRDKQDDKAVSPRRAARANPFLRGSWRAKSCPVLNAAGKVVRRITTGDYTCALQKDYHVPFTIASGRGGSGAVVIVDEAGTHSTWTKQWAKLAGGFARRIVTMDVFGCGALATTLKPVNDYHARLWAYYGANHHAVDALMAGRCPIGLAMEEVGAVVRSARLDVKPPEPPESPEPLVLIGRGWPALALALLAGHWKMVQGCGLSGMPESYQALLRAGHHHLGYAYLVPGLLTQTDWPDLIQQDAATRYAICEPIRMGPPTGLYDDPRQFPHVRLFEKDTPAARRKAAAFLAGTAALTSSS